MTLIAGLGNVGLKYEQTRHNAGFMLLDLLLRFLNDFTSKPSQESSNLSANLANLSAPKLVSNAKFKGELYKSGDLLLLKPHTFMNASGESVKAVCDFYKPSRVIILHDDIDLPLGALKFKKGGSSGGHNGLKSIDALCSADYERVRIGIGRREPVISFVLEKFRGDELEILNSSLNQGLKALISMLQGANIDEIAAKFSLNPKKANSSETNLNKANSNQTNSNKINLNEVNSSKEREIQ